MAIITNTIGSGGRDYSTIDAWLAALPSDFVAAGNSYVGACYNDSEFMIGGGSPFYVGSGLNTDASHTLTLTAAVGESFSDNASATSNVLRYDQTNGVGLFNSWNYSPPLAANNNNLLISRLQVRGSRGGLMAGGSSGARFEQMLVQHNTDGPGLHANFMGGMCYCANSVIIQNANGGNTIGCNFERVVPWTCTNVTFVIPGTSGGSSYAVRSHYGAGSVFTNCAFFGYGGFADGTSNSAGADTYITCATDLSPGFTGITGGLTYTAQFVDTTVSTYDFRTILGANLINSGTADTTHIPAAVDIVGTSRPQGGRWDIGAWELIGVPSALLARRSLWQRVGSRGA